MVTALLVAAVVLVFAQLEPAFALWMLAWAVVSFPVAVFAGRFIRCGASPDAGELRGVGAPRSSSRAGEVRQCAVSGDEGSVRHWPASGKLGSERPAPAADWSDR